MNVVTCFGEPRRKKFSDNTAHTINNRTDPRQRTEDRGQRDENNVKTSVEALPVNPCVTVMVRTH